MFIFGWTLTLETDSNVVEMLMRRSHCSCLQTAISDLPEWECRDGWRERRCWEILHPLSLGSFRGRAAPQVYFRHEHSRFVWLRRHLKCAVLGGSLGSGLGNWCRPFRTSWTHTVSTPDANNATNNNSVYLMQCSVMRRNKSPTVNWCPILFLTYSKRLL